MSGLQAWIAAMAHAKARPRETYMMAMMLWEFGSKIVRLKLKDD